MTHAAADPDTLRLARAEATLGPDPDHLLRWARVVAVGVAAAFRFRRGGRDEEELVAVARQTLWERALHFDPARVPPGGDPLKLFKGWSHPTIRAECRRHAERLRNGGTYHRRRGGPPVVVVPLCHPRPGDPGDDPGDVPDHRGAGREPDDAAGALVRRALAVLPPRLRACLALLYGLPPAAHPHSHAEAAAVLRVTRGRVREIERDALAELRGALA